MRLIDVDAIPESATAISTDGRLFVAWSEIVKAPTIDPESLRPKGRKERSAISETGLMCTNCYSDVDMDAVFCKYCGAKMEE